MSLTSLMKTVLANYEQEGETARSINDGLCSFFVSDVLELADKIGFRGVQQRCYGEHEVIFYKGKYYDAEKLRGVSEVKNLPFCKRNVKLCFPRGRLKRK